MLCVPVMWCEIANLFVCLFAFRTVLLLIRIILEYCQCVDNIPSIATDMLTRLSDLLKVKIAQAVGNY